MRIGIRESLLYTEPYKDYFQALDGELRKARQFKHCLRFAEFLTKKFGLTPDVARGSLLWLHNTVSSRPKRGLDFAPLFESLVAYAQIVKAEPLWKPELRYIVDPQEDLRTISHNMILNVRWMIEHFGLQFFAAKCAFRFNFPDKTYYLDLRGGLYENNFGVELVLGNCKDGVHPDKGAFARVGFDTVGDSLRVVRIGGVKGRGHIINEEFPRKMGINPFRLLILLLVQFAYQNGFREVTGIKESYHPHIKFRAGNMSYVNYYRTLGMRKHRGIVHYRSIEDEDAYRYFEGRVRPPEVEAFRLFTFAWNEMHRYINPYKIKDDDYPLPDCDFLRIENRNWLVGGR